MRKGKCSSHIALALILCVAIGLSASCTTNAPPAAETTQAASAQTTASAQETTTAQQAASTAESTTATTETQTEKAASDGTAWEDWVRKEGTYTYMRRVTQDSAIFEESYDFWRLEQVYGIKLEFIKVPSEVWEEKKNLAFATDDLPDMFTWGLDDPIEIATYGKQGMLLPLEDYINWKNTPTVMKWFEVQPGYKESLYYPDGHIYNMAGFNVIPREQSKARAWMNETFANEILGHMPTTLDEYYEFLAGCKAMGKIPMSGRFLGLTEQYGAGNDTDGTQPILFALGMVEKLFEPVNGIIQFNPVTPLYKEYLLFMNKLWTNELIDPAYFTQTQDQYRATLSTGNVGVFVDGAPWQSMPDEELWTQYPLMQPLTSEFNDTAFWGANDLAVFSHLTITKKCKDPEHLIQIANYGMCFAPSQGPDGFIKPEIAAAFGDDYEKMAYTADGTPIKPQIKLGDWDMFPEFGREWVKNDAENSTNPWLDTTTSWPSEFETLAEFNKWHMPALWDHFTVAWWGNSRNGANPPDDWLTDNLMGIQYPVYKYGWPLTVKFTGEEADELSLLETDLKAYCDQMISKFIIGEISIEGEFDNYVKECERRSLNRILEIRQDAYNRYINAQ